MLKRIRRCRFCNRSMSNVTADSYAGNPFCDRCYDERVPKRQQHSVPVRGKYFCFNQESGTHSEDV